MRQFLIILVEQSPEMEVTLIQPRVWRGSGVLGVNEKCGGFITFLIVEIFIFNVPFITCFSLVSFVFLGRMSIFILEKS